MSGMLATGHGLKMGGGGNRLFAAPRHKRILMSSYNRRHVASSAARHTSLAAVSQATPLPLPFEPTFSPHFALKPYNLQPELNGIFDCSQLSP